MKQLSFYIIALLFIPGLHAFGQVSIAPDSTAPHSSAMLEVKATNKGVLIPRMTQAQRQAISAPANGLMVFQINGIRGFYYFIENEWSRIGVNAGHYVGEHFGGGVVFWVDESGEHGLIVSLVNISISATWSNITNVLIGPTAQSTWNGLANSNAIMGQQGHTSSAAKLCDDYTNDDCGTGIYDDWFLPSMDMLMTMFHSRYILNKNIVIICGGDNIANETYWSSTEASDTSAWGCGVYEASKDALIKSEPLYVRAVRAF